MKLSVLALDYDGTIAHGDVLDPTVHGAIASARTNGIITLLVTGRILSELERVTGQLHFVDGVVAENSGVDGGVVVEKMRCGSGNFGFDAGAAKYVDLVEAGIIDPTKVVRLALENAVSVAGVLLLTEATMTEVPEPKAESSPLPAGDM
jgi:hypothetical protein